MIKRPWFKEILSSDKGKSKEMIESIEQAKRQNQVTTLPANNQKQD
jgi:hypothetical protein